MNKAKHKHIWSTHGCNFYQIFGTRLWVFRRCMKCKATQEAIVDTESRIRWKNWNTKK